MSANGLHRIRSRRVAVARIHRTAASQFARDLLNIQQSIVEEEVKNVGKRTPSDPMETRCSGKNPLDCRESVIILYENCSAAIVLSRSQFPYNRRHTIDTIMDFIIQAIQPSRFLASNCVTE